MTGEQETNHAFARSRSNAGLSSAFQQAVHHAYAQTDGTYAWPNSREGDMLREAKREIEQMRVALAAYKRDAERYRWLRHGDNDELVIQHGPVAHDYHWLPRNERLDAMIDSAMTQGG